jgi:hypothetical protein
MRAAVSGPEPALIEPAPVQPGSPEVLLSTLPAPALAASPGEHGSVEPAVDAREQANQERSKAERGPAAADKAGPQAPKPITQALAKAAAKILDTSDSRSAGSTAAPTKAQPPRRQEVPVRSAAAAKRVPSAAGKSTPADPFNDRL